MTMNIFVTNLQAVQQHVVLTVNIVSNLQEVP